MRSLKKWLCHSSGENARGSNPVCILRDIRELFGITGGLRRFAVLLALRCPFDALNTLLQAMFLQRCFDAVDRQSTHALYTTCVLFVVGNSLLFVYNGTVWRAFSAFYTKWTGAMRRALFGRLTELSFGQIEARPSGEWISRQNADTQTAASLLGHPYQLPHAAYLIVNIAVSSVMLLCISPAMYGMTLLFVLPQLLMGRFIVTAPMAALSQKALGTTAENTADLSALITCADTALLYDAKGFLLGRFERSSLRLRRDHMRMHCRAAVGSGLLPIFGLCGYLVILWIGGAWIARGNMTFGGLTAIFQYRIGVQTGVTMLISCAANISRSLAGVGRVLETMRMPPEE